MILTPRFANKAKAACLILAGAGLMSGCNGDKPAVTSGGSDVRSAYETATDKGLGDPNAPITVVEYASVTCGHCANWDKTVWPEFRKNYVDTGKVRYVFRPFPTAPVELATAGHLLASCAPDDKYFDLIHVQMQRQNQILSSQDIKGEYVALAKSAGMSEADFDACMANEEEISRLEDIVRGGFDAGVTGTPTFFVNGEKAKAYVLEDFEKIFAPILGEPVNTTPEEHGAEDAADHKDGH